MKGAWSVVFISSDRRPSGRRRLAAGSMTSVFLPCTPNPTTGFYFYVPTTDIIELAMTPEDAAKLIMSAGLIQPEGAGGARRLWPEAARRDPAATADVAPAPEPSVAGGWRARLAVMRASTYAIM